MTDKEYEETKQKEMRYVESCIKWGSDYFKNERKQIEEELTMIHSNPKEYCKKNYLTEEELPKREKN